MIDRMVPIDRLIELVRRGGRVRTGVDVYDRSGTLLLAKDILVDKVNPLEIIRRHGLRSVPLARNGGVFDSSGNSIPIKPGALGVQPDLGIKPPDFDALPASGGQDVARRLKEIRDIRQEAAWLNHKAAFCLKKAFADIHQNKGQFDTGAVESQVGELAAFIDQNDHPFSYLARNLFSHDSYLFSHAVNVCALGTSVVSRFNTSFSKAVEAALWEDEGRSGEKSPPCFSYYFPEDIKEISLGFFIFDMGKALVPESLLNKSTPLTRGEVGIVRRHSYEFGEQILAANRLTHPILANLVQYHHGPLFDGEKNCYPPGRSPSDLPPYVRICKLVDIYDAMISRRSYGEAGNQVTAATALFRTYVKKNPLLQHILHAFVSTIGLYPPGSIVFLKNGQMACVLESRGPILLPFTDRAGRPLDRRPDPFDAGGQKVPFQIDNDKSVKAPKEIIHCLPSFIKPFVMSGPEPVS